MIESIFGTWRESLGAQFIIASWEPLIDVLSSDICQSKRLKDSIVPFSSGPVSVLSGNGLM